MNTVQKVCLEIGAGAAIGLGVGEGFHALIFNTGTSEVDQVQKCANYLGQTGLTAAGLEQYCDPYLTEFSATSISNSQSTGNALQITLPTKSEFLNKHLKKVEDKDDGSSLEIRIIADSVFPVLGGLTGYTQGRERRNKIRTRLTQQALADTLAKQIREERN